MARPKNEVPTYKLHSSTGLARCWVNGKWVTLGKHGSPESKAEFERILAELRTGVPPPGIANLSEPTVDEVLLAFWAHAEQHYRREDGTPTNQIVEYRYTLKPLRALYGHTPAGSFGPLALKTVRAKMVAAGWCRSQVNRRIDMVKHVFKWAVAGELVPVAIYQALATVAGLQRGRTPARETEPIRPVDSATVDATLPYLPRHVAGLVRFQQLTGCRPGEACTVRRCDIDTSGAVWRYSPKQHKTAYAGGNRTIAIGPRAQSLLAGFFTPDTSGYLFSPRRAVAEQRAARTAKRRTPLYPSHVKHNAKRRTPAPKRLAADRYSTHSYGQAIGRAVEAAVRAYIEAAVDVELHPSHWAVNQLRHSFATEVRKGHGLESAGAALGHTKMSATEVYAERDQALAAAVAAEMG